MSGDVYRMIQYQFPAEWAVARSTAIRPSAPGWLVKLLAWSGCLGIERGLKGLEI